MVEERICMPVSGMLGFIGGLANEFLRIQNRYAGLTFEKIDDPFTEEI
jgi:hypothetical protein